ncbi:MAG: nitronate monooxygenase, partial [Prevotella sp.]|nr:nitronate monooxygenase [Prevotella sp.]
KIAEAENAGASADELREISGTAAAKRGIFEGDVEGGYLEIGQIASAIKEIKPVNAIMETLVKEYLEAKKSII